MGVLAKPHGLTYVLDNGIRRLPDERFVAITTKRSTKAPWADLSLQATVENGALLRMARPQVLRPFEVQPDAHLIAPLVTLPQGGVALPSDVDDPRFRKELPKTRAYWRKADTIYQERRSAKAGETLLHNLDWKGSLTGQLAVFGDPSAGKRLTKVVYNESGRSELRASRCAETLIASGSLYWMIARSETEALYLVGVINAPCMQDAYRASKTSMNHFDKNPWRKIPVPRYSRTNSVHRAVVEAARRAEREVRRRGQWDRSGESAQLLSRAVGELLPDHAS